MNIKIQQPAIPLDRIEDAIRLDLALVILGLALGAWVIYKLLLRRVSDERHRNLKSLFWNLSGHIVLASLLVGLYWHLQAQGDDKTTLRHLAGYIGLFGLISGAIVFIKTARILLFEYLFLGHMRQGVPVLSVNLLTLVLSLFIAGWMATEIFSVKVTSLLATSAIFSVVIGLALQDTLGNLFAGAALQFDKPYEIGDWVEVFNGSQKWVGQVHEISWRATVLNGLSDELITIPNRIVAQAQVSNFATKRHPILRSQILRFPYGTSLERVREVLIQATLRVPSVRSLPSPTVLFAEAGESSMVFKLLYFIDDYGSQLAIGDKVLSVGVQALREAGLNLAPPLLKLTEDSTGSDTRRP